MPAHHPGREGPHQQVVRQSLHDIDSRRFRALDGITGGQAKRRHDSGGRQGQCQSNQHGPDGPRLRLSRSRHRDPRRQRRHGRPATHDRMHRRGRTKQA